MRITRLVVWIAGIATCVTACGSSAPAPAVPSASPAATDVAPPATDVAQAAPDAADDDGPETRRGRPPPAPPPSAWKCFRPAGAWSRQDPSSTNEKDCHHSGKGIGAPGTWCDGKTVRCPPTGP